MDDADDVPEPSGCEESGESQAEADYRMFLVRARQEAEVAHDKAVMTLAGGGLLISIAFVRYVAGPSPSWPWLLAVSWLLFALSLICVFQSFLAGRNALDAAIRDLDRPGHLWRQIAKGEWTKKTENLNRWSGRLLVTGIGCLMLFCFRNVIK